MHASLRSRVMAVVVGIFSVAWIAVATWDYIDISAETTDLLDAELRHTAAVVMGMSVHELSEELVSRSSSTIDIPAHEEIRGDLDAKIALQVWQADGRMALRTANAPQLRLANAGTGFVDADVGMERWRVYALTDSATGITVLVGEGDSVRRELSQDKAFHTVFPLAVVVPLVGLLTWFFIGLALEPLNQLAGQVSRRQPDDFRSINVNESPDETAPLINALNKLFERLQASFENTRRFTADAAHELRTPLGAIAVQADVALLATDTLDRSTALGYIKQAIRQMNRMMQQLLILARCDAELADLPRSPVDLVEILHAVINDLTPYADARNISVTVTATAHPKPIANEMSVHLVARNLLDNALRYTPAGGKVSIEIDSTENFAVLRVVDTGPGIAPELRERLFQRFYRAGRSGGEGSGLGLSIVHRCVEVHNGTITVMEPEGGGLVVTVRIPLTR